MSRQNIRNALSDLFHYLRYPDLPSRFTTAVSGWISELVCFIFKITFSCSYVKEDLLIEKKLSKNFLNFEFQVAALLKACISSDQQYLLCQVLRLVSPVSRWAAPLLQSFIETDSINDRLIIDNYIVMMSMLLSPIR